MPRRHSACAESGGDKPSASAYPAHRNIAASDSIMRRRHRWIELRVD